MTLKRKMMEGEPAFGFELTLGSVQAVEMMAAYPLDFHMLDLQHGRWNDESVLLSFMAASGLPAPAAPRVRRNDYWHIGRVLDDGATGIVVPAIDVPEDARRVVEAAHYPPLGRRSWGWGRAPYAEQAAYRTRFASAAFIAIQIESATAVANAEALLATEGIDGCWIGPADLALSMGLTPEVAANDDGHRRAIERVLQACRDTGKIPGFASGSAREALARAAEGFRFLTVGNEIGFIRQGCEATVAALREGTAAETPPSSRYG